MMKVKIEVIFFAHFYEEADVKNIGVEIDQDSFLFEVISIIDLVTGFQLSEKLGKECSILINGRSSNLYEENEIVFEDGDRIAVIPLIGGG
jgi:molybdopterin converting factor small subunit